MRYKSSAKKEEIILFVEEYILENQKSPTIAEIAEAMNNSKSTIHSYLLEMDSEGMISYKKREFSTGKTAKYALSVSSVKLLNNGASCGPACADVEDIQAYVKLPTSIFGTGNLFIVTASGDSMEDVGISDGDMLVVNVNGEPNIGSIVIALNDFNEVNCKEYRGFDKKSGKFILAYRNENKYPGETISTELNGIQGVVTHIIKSAIK